MARSRTYLEMKEEAYRYADATGDVLRHPLADVGRWVNKGLAELYDLLTEARGRDYYRSSSTITLVSGTVDYALPATFYKLVGFRRTDGGALLPYEPAQDAELRDGAAMVPNSPRYYQLRGANVTFLPTPSTGTVECDFVPAFVDLSADGDTFDGVSGWEDYACLFAARRMAIKDEAFELAATLAGDMAGLAERVRRLAPTRDSGAARRVKDVRGQQQHARMRWWR